MPILKALVESMISLPGALGAAIVDINSGQTLAKAGQIDPEVIETAGIANARLLRLKMGMAKDQYGQDVEDILITLTDDYHLIRLVRRPEKQARQFLYVVLTRTNADLPLSRLNLTEVEEQMFKEDGGFRLMDIECDYVLDLDNIRSKIERIIYDWENNVVSEEDPEEEMPSFMRTDAALKLLGFSADDTARLTIVEHPTHNRRT